MLNLAAIATPVARLFGGGQNECIPRIAAICAAIAAIALALAAAWHNSPAHADGGASARNQTTAPAPDDSDATAQAHAQRILRALTDRDANNWVRYWQARVACAAAERADRPAPIDRVLLTLTASLCAQLEARLAVNPAAYSPRDEDRTVGLLLNEPDAAVGYTLFVVRGGRNVYLIDPLGRIAYAWHLENTLPGRTILIAHLLDSGNLMAMTNLPRALVEVNPRGNIVWEYKIEDRLHHDFLKMPNGNILLLVQARKTREEAIAAGANPQFVHERGVKHDYLIEVRPADASGGEIVWEWSVWDHLVQDFDPTKPNYGAIAEHPELIDINFPPIPLLDWTHINAIDYNPELDQIMLSPRHFSELWIIDRSVTTEEARGNIGGNGGMGGDLLYRWGNPRAYGQGAAADQRLFWQHQAHWIPPGLPGAGNILVFNNGKEFPGYERSHSSIDELVPPADGYRYRRADAAYPPDALAWTYASPTPADFYAPFLSGAQRLPNGNTLIADGPAEIIFQATPDGRIVWKYVVPIDGHIHLRQGIPPPAITNGVHRAYWYHPDHPGLRALDLAPGAFIEDTPDMYDIAGDAAIAGAFGERLADSDFDIYLDQGENRDNRRLIYIKQPCAAEDARHKFFLHIIPADVRDIPADKREHGFDKRDFRFRDIGKASHGRCIAIAPLPRYSVERIRTGQFTDAAGELWSADIDLRE